MPYCWDEIQAESEPERRVYRLLGEMLARRASGTDLERIRDFLAVERPGVEVWHALGEALFHTARGGSSGYVLWTSWGRATLGPEYDEGQMLAAWQRFRINSSESLEETTDGGERYTDFDEQLAIFIDEAIEDLETDEELDRTSVLESERVPPPVTSILAASAPQLMSCIPSGPHTIRLLGEVYDDVDEFTILALVRRGLMLGTEILAGGRWVRVERHPAFEVLVRRMTDEARRVLAHRRCETVEKTQPGT